MKILRDLN